MLLSTSWRNGQGMEGFEGMQGMRLCAKEWWMHGERWRNDGGARMGRGEGKRLGTCAGTKYIVSEDKKRSGVENGADNWRNKY